MALPIRFGAAQRQLVGMHHAPEPAADLRHGVLLCNPFGQEAIRCHRLLKVLAERLARAGLHALRFDYYGSGDSGGDDEEASLEGWIDDTVLAREELARVSGAATTSCFGLRLGASVAMLASARGRGGPERMVLWDPVVSGATYLDELTEAHTSSMLGKLLAAPTWTARTDGEALGFPLPPAFEQPVRELRAEAFGGTRAARIHIVHSPFATGLEELQRVLRSGRAAVSATAIDSRVAWTADQAANSAIAPADGVEATITALTAAT